MSVDALVIDVGPVAIERSVRTAKVPYAPAPPGIGEQPEKVLHPPQRCPVWGPIEGAELADVYADTQALQLLPWPDPLTLQDIAVTDAGLGLKWPAWLGPGVGLRKPGRSIVTDPPGVVRMQALRDPQPGEAWHRRPTQVQAVRDDEPVRVPLPYRSRKPFDDRVVGTLVDVHGLVQEIEAEPVVRDAAIAVGEGRPLIGAGLLCRFVCPQVSGFERSVDAVARGAMEVDAHVQPVLPPPIDRLVDLDQNRLAELVEVALDSPGPVIHRQPHEGKSPARQEFEV